MNIIEAMTSTQPTEPRIVRGTRGYSHDSRSSSIALRPSRSLDPDDDCRLSDSTSESESSDLCHDLQSASSSRFPRIAEESCEYQGQKNGAQLSLAHLVVPDEPGAADKEVLECPPWYKGILLPPRRDIVRQEGKIPTYKLDGLQLDELINQKIIDSGSLRRRRRRRRRRP